MLLKNLHELMESAAALPPEYAGELLPDPQRGYRAALQILLGNGAGGWEVGS
jgi:hypothetical protein